jgi:hypothetical protein
MLGVFMTEIKLNRARVLARVGEITAPKGRLRNSMQK